MRRAAQIAALTLGGVLLALVIAAGLRTGLYAPEPTLMLLDREGRFLGEVPASDGAERLGFWPIEELPMRVAITTLAVEDQRFYQHPGVDPFAVLRAIGQNLESGQRISGASTIPMQLARLQHPGSRTYLRKAVEATTALLLVQIHGRDAVLRHYLTLAPYGNNVHGIKYAARRYFDKPIEDLSWAETALLCALPQSPGRMNPYNEDGKARGIERAGRILDLLYNRGRLEESVYHQAVIELSHLHVPSRPSRPPAALHPVLHLARQLGDADVRRQFYADPIIRTSIDLAQQERVQGVLWRAVRRWAARGAGNAAAVVAERVEEEGEVRYLIRASVGSTDWFGDLAAGSIDYTQVRRHPGSALKPFIYARALDSGVITAGTVVDDVTRGPDGIGNADRRFLGPMLPRQALGNSRNVPAVALAKRLGLANLFGTYRDLGLHSERYALDYYGLGIALGGMPVRLVDLVRAYTALAEDGGLRELRWYDRQPARLPEPIFTAAAARSVSGFLSDPMARLPSFPRMGHTEYPFPVAVKTGTSVDYRDAWTVAYSRRYIVGVWLGHPDWTPMKRLAGYSGASVLARRILLPLHGDERDGLSDATWPAPEGYVAREVCTLSGALATDACTRVGREWFTPETVPVNDCTFHRRLAVDRDDGELANPGTPAERVELRTFFDLPERYAEWARREKLPLLPRLEPHLRDTRSPRVRILSPQDGSHVIGDPESPAQFTSLPLRGVIDPPVPQAAWYVNGEPFALVDYPYTTRWPVRAGEHEFELRVPFVASSRSRPVRVVAR